MAAERRYGLELARAYARSEDERSDEENDAIIASECARWGAPFTAWRLGDKALGMASLEREAMLDRAIDAFEAIVNTPIDPGNDEGPFWKIAAALDERQICRALMIIDRMDAPRWCYQLAGSRSQLAIRLAWLGHWQEATVQLERMMTNDPFAPRWRAETYRGIIGARLALEPELAASGLLVPGDSAWRWGVIEGLVEQFRDLPAPSGERVSACITYASSITDDRLRDLAFERMAGTWITALPAERWIELGVEPLALAEAIHDAGGDPTAMLARVPRAMPRTSKRCAAIAATSLRRPVSRRGRPGYERTSRITSSTWRPCSCGSADRMLPSRWGARSSEPSPEEWD